MDCAQALKQLKAFGSEQTFKTYRRHGAVGPLFGVKYGDLNKMVRQIKSDHALALQLWDSGILDARVLAGLIADPEQMTMAGLTNWMKDVDCHGLSVALSNVAQRSPVAKKMMAKWMKSRTELVASTSWLMLGGITRESPELFTKSEYKAFLKTIEKDIHQSKNRVKASMNSALIGIGTYIDEKAALAVAGRIGKVEVDHGDTSCKTPLAVPYIKKAAAKYRAKLAKK